MPTGLEESMAAAGLALAVPGVIDLMIKYGTFIKDKVRLFRDHFISIPHHLFVVP